MTTTFETLTQLASEIRALPGVQAANVWARVAGHEAIYVELTKQNGGRAWNGGSGRVLVVSATGACDWKRGSEWAGATTRKHHEELGTFEAVQALAAAAFPAEQQ
mgnify:CR=1 FL=1